MDKTTLQKICSKIESCRDEMIDMQAKLTATKPIGPDSGGKGEWEKAKIIKSFMNKLNFDLFEEHNVPDTRVPEGTRPNFVARINGKDTSKTVWIMAHLDVVPANPDEWNSDPFKIKVDGDKIYGRGVEDNNQAIVSVLFSIQTLRALKNKPNYSIGLVLVSDEESGNAYGLEHVLKSTNIFKKEDLFLVPDAGNSDATNLLIAEKGVLWMKIITEGKQTHGSTPERGINAHKAGAHLITRLENLYKDFDSKDELFELHISSFEPTMKEKNVDSINTIPGQDIFYMDCRINPDYQPDSIINKVRGYCQGIENEFKVKISIEIPYRADAAPITPPDTPVAMAIKKAVKEIYGVEAKPIGICGGTVASLFRQAGFHAVCWTKIDETLHEPNEYCRISNMIGDAKVFAHIFLQE